MGWLSDFVSDPIGTVSSTVSNIGSQTHNFFKDPGQTFQGVGNDAVEIGKRGVGTYYSLGTSLIQNDTAQRLLRDKTVSQLSFGVSENYADFGRTAQHLRTGSEVSNAEWQGSGRFIVDAAAVGGAIYAAPAAATTFVNSGAKNIASTYLLGQVGNSQLQRGNIAGAAIAIGGGTTLNEYLPDTGIPGLGGDSLLNQLLPHGNPSSPSSAPRRYPAYNTGTGWSGSDTPNPYQGPDYVPLDSGTTVPTKSVAVVAGLGLLALYYLRKKS